LKTKALLIYDGDCPLCQRARKWIEAHVPQDTLETLPCQDPDRPARAPMVSLEDCMSAMQLILPDGRLYSADKAFPPLLGMTRYGRYAAWLFYVPGIAWLYRQVARNRLALSALLFRKTPGAGCSIDKGCD